MAGDLVIFAGAGISTESSRVLKFTLYDEIEYNLGVGSNSLPFPELMQKFSNRPDGRIQLLSKIKNRLEHIDSFPELNFTASRFHRELGTLFLISEIVTTNWDSYFERYCGATPFVTDPDISMWNAASRKVLKIHGSINNLGSIVATADDYAACASRLNVGLIGSLLKTILATKTVVFVGYSLRDTDFQQIYGFVKNQMQSLGRQAYAVTPFSDEADRFSTDGLIPLRTDGGFFVRQLKAHVLGAGEMLHDIVFDWAADLRDKVSAEHRLLHERFSLKSLPEVIYAASYQDGLAHALERAFHMKGTGEYSHVCRVRGLVHSYLGMQKEKLSARKYEDVAYIEGYLNGLLFLLMSNDKKSPVKVPMYFSFGEAPDLYSVSGMARFFSKNKIPHQRAHRRALSLIKKIQNPDKIEFHHPPWL
jgi:hypothetical protein